jgi:hypothetical protein
MTKFVLVCVYFVTDRCDCETKNSKNSNNSFLIHKSINTVQEINYYHKSDLNSTEIRCLRVDT